MSRIGNKPIIIPSNVSVTIFQNAIKIEGPFGNLLKKFLSQVFFEKNNSELLVKIKKESTFSKSYQGLVRTLLANMIAGVSHLFSKTLILEGIGYKFQLSDNYLILNIGSTHPVKFELNSDLQFILESPTKLTIKGIDKELVGLFAANIRKVRPPEPYKGKGIFYLNEKIKKKTGKK